MKNKIKTIYGEEAFKVTVGKTIASISPSYNSVEIHFTDGSYINIEVSSYGGCCHTNHGDDYCYCSAPEVTIEPYFSEKK